MRQYQIALQRRQILMRDALVGEQPETGADAIDRPVLGDDPVDQRGGGGDAGVAGPIERNLGAAGRDAA